MLSDADLDRIEAALSVDDQRVDLAWAEDRGRISTDDVLALVLEARRSRTVPEPPSEEALDRARQAVGRRPEPAPLDTGRWEKAELSGKGPYTVLYTLSEKDGGADGQIIHTSIDGEQWWSVEASSVVAADLEAAAALIRNEEEEAMSDVKPTEFPFDQAADGGLRGTLAGKPYPTRGDLPAQAAAGDLAFVRATGATFVFHGGGWALFHAPAGNEEKADG